MGNPDLNLQAETSPDPRPAGRHSTQFRALNATREGISNAPFAFQRRRRKS